MMEQEHEEQGDDMEHEQTECSGTDADVSAGLHSMFTGQACSAFTWECGDNIPVPLSIATL